MLTDYRNNLVCCFHLTDCVFVFAEPRPGDKLPSFDPFVLEKWPLIQAFALEGFGR